MKRTCKESRGDKSLTYNLMKAMAVLSVLLFHVVSMNTDYGTFSPARVSPILANLADCLHLVNMPLFIATAGCVYGFCLEMGKYERVGAFLLNKSRRLLLPNFFFGCCLVAPVMIYCRLTTLDYAQYVLSGIFLASDSRHLWYLLALFWIFCLAILLKPLCKKKHPWYLLISVGILLSDLLLPTPDVLQLHNALHYQIYFFLGVWINQFYREIYRMLRPYRRYFFFLAPLALWTAPQNGGEETVVFFWAILGVFNCLLFCDFWSERYPEVRENILYRVLNRNGFGIYLFHPLVIYLLDVQLVAYPLSPYTLALMVFCTSFLVSTGLTEGLRKCHLGILVGEKPKGAHSKRSGPFFSFAKRGGIAMSVRSAGIDEKNKPTDF